MRADIHSQLRVVLVRPRNPLNIGAAARALSNFGFAHLRVVNPYEVAFREARSAVGASQVLAQAAEYTDVPSAIADCGLAIGTTAVGHRQVQHPLRRLEEAAYIIRAQDCPVALLFGSEKRGLSNDDLSYCHWLLHIPTSEQNLSMNLGQAIAVCLYELARQHRPIVEQAPPKPADGRQLNRLTVILNHALIASGYSKANTEAATEEKTRRLIRRLNLSSVDAELLLGMLRKIARNALP